MTNKPILLVEDKQEEVELTTWAFRKEGFSNEIIVARDGAEALSLLLPSQEREPLLPSIVLMNLNMPGMTGLEALRRLRAEPATWMLPVIMLSDSAEDRDLLKSQSLGANGFIKKPVSYAAFLSVAHELGVTWLEKGR